MTVETFAAERRDRMVQADDELRSLVVSALSQWTATGRWYDDLTEAAAVLWLEIFSAETDADPAEPMAAFREMLGEALSLTKEPANPPDPIQVDRVTNWLSTATINDATHSGNVAAGGAGMRWATMHDADVRLIHRVVDGQTASADGTFVVGGVKLRYPGEPVGDPEVWINCRCILVPARVEGALDVAEPLVAASETIVGEADVEVDDELVPDEPEDGEELITEIPVHGVATIEGKPTGDGRNFSPGAITFAPTPQPLGFEFESSHGGDNSRVAIIGRIDEFWKHDNGEYVEIRYRGVIFPDKEHASEALEGVIDGSYGGVSIIADEITLDVEATQFAADTAAPGRQPDVHISEARVRRFDMVPTPAYQEGNLMLGDLFADEMDDEMREQLLAAADCGCYAGPEDDDENDSVVTGYDVVGETFAPGTKDGPGWITHPIATARIRRYWVRGKGAGKIKWGAPGDFNRCRRQLVKYVQNPQWLAGLCANMHKEALGIWPGQHRGHLSSEGISMSLLAAGVATRPAEAFKDPQLSGPTPITIDPETGRIFGHLAAWGVCHIGIQDVCTVAPHSSTQYAFFRTGSVHTDEGVIPVGQITMGTGHASIKANAKGAVAHYDNTGSVVADVAAGEDAHGIWVAGLLRPDVDPEKAAQLAASALSGDWRRTAAGLELVAALAVNVPGFPIPRTSLHASADIGQESLVAAGVIQRDGLTASTFMSPDDVAGIVRAAVEEYRETERRMERLSALAPFFESVKADAEEKRAAAISQINNYFQEA